MDAKLDALITAPFKVGRRQLEDAADAWRSPDDRQRLLYEARTSFSKALMQDSDAMRSSLAAVHLAAVSLALGAQPDVERNLRDAHVHALRGFVGALPMKQSVGAWILGGPRDGELLSRGAPLAEFANRLAGARLALGTPTEQAPTIGKDWMRHMTRSPRLPADAPLPVGGDLRDPYAVSAWLGRIASP